MLSILVILFCGITGIFSADKCTWKNCPEWPKLSNGINVHIIPHTHDDLGWIKTVDDYYTGANQWLVPVGVQYIINTVIDELEKSPDRKFSYAETGFLTRWLEDHDFEQIEKLKTLVKTGQFEFIGGGWVQPDEAGSHYVELIDQYTLGLRKLNATFGECGRPKVAWQIDPFGHSREHANLVAMIGYEALFFARIHYLEMDVRKANKTMEFIWNASDDLKTNILTGVFYNGTYGSPPGFCFDRLCQDDPIIDNIGLQGYNVDERVDQFLKFVTEKASVLKHNNVMVLMGGDFTYTNSNSWFTNLDKLIKGANAKSDKTNITLAYSTPTCYVQSLNEAGPRLPQKIDDFFPYATSNHSYWTGYFTSKPALKGLIRKSSSFLQTIRQLNSFVNPSRENFEKEEILEKAIGLSMHHDAVTGTSKENVTKDYERRLLGGINVGEDIINGAVQILVKRASNSTEFPHQTLCTRLNETICESAKQRKFTVTVFNGNTHKIDSIVRIPYYGKSCIVKGADNDEISHQIVKTFFPITQRNTSEQAPNELTFPVKVPALGFKTYFVNEEDEIFKIKDVNEVVPIRKRIRKKKIQKSISNNLIQLNFDENGYLAQMKDLKSGVVHDLNQEFFYYEGMSNLNYTTQATGAYIFRPVETAPKRFGNKVQLEIIEGPIVNESRQIISPWVSQIIRLFPNKPYVEFEWTVGPIPKEQTDPIAKEVITRYTVKNLASNGLFQTDANGRQLILRKKNFNLCYKYNNTEPVSANYYPINSRISVSDSKRQLMVLNDRSEGGTSLKDGQIEIMLHRRAFNDDGWGVEEALDEPGEDGRGLVVRGKHWLLLGAPEKIRKLHRTIAYELFYEPVLTFASYDSIEAYNKNFIAEFSGITTALPPEINLLTLKRLSPDSILLRLEHIFQNGENPNLFTPIQINIDTLFTRFEIISMEELNLAGNLQTGVVYNWPNSWNDSKRRNKPLAKESITVELKPMEIKTWKLHVISKT